MNRRPAGKVVETHVFVIGKIDFSYSLDEDRIYMTCLSPAGTAVRLALTRRMVRSVLREATKLLSMKSQLPAATCGAMFQEALAMEHMGALAETAQVAAGGERKPKPCVERCRLITQFKIEAREGNFLIVLCEREEPVAAMTPTRQELHRVLAAFTAWATEAQWDLEGDAGWLARAAFVAASSTGIAS